jgi:GT2 family glycosyltransferase
MPKANKKVSLIILNYNGKALLEECLPSVISAARYSSANNEVIVIDNNSTDDSVQFLEDKFPAVKVIELKRNWYLFSYNEVIKNCQSDYIILLNNDIKVDKNIIEPLIEKMKNGNIFSVMPNIRDWNGSKYKEEGNKNRLYFRKGWMDWERVEDEAEGITFFTCAGAALYDRKKFLDLGGFDELYFPGYVEDVDLSFRAWKRGWTNYYVPESLAFHKDSVSMKRYFGNEKVGTLKIRNKYLFFWKNIHDRKLCQEHIKYIPLTVIKSLIKGKITLIYGLKQALGTVKKAKNRRIQEKAKTNELSDRDILQLFSKQNESQESIQRQ